MGPDPLLGGAPFLVSGIFAAVLLALVVTVLPVLRGHQMSDGRVRAARWSSIGVITAAVPIVFTETAGGMHGFTMIAVLVFMAAATILRATRGSGL